MSLSPLASRPLPFLKHQPFPIYLTASISIHILLFFIGTLFWIKPVEIAQPIGDKSTEVSLIAVAPESPALPVTTPSPPVSKSIPTTPPPSVDKTKDAPDDQPSTAPTTNSTVMQEHINPPPAPRPEQTSSQAEQPPSASYAHHSETNQTTSFATYRPEPDYPFMAQEARQEGTVTLQIDVDSTGNPTRIVVIQSSGYELLDHAAVRGVKRWKFQPATMGGLAIDSTVTQAVHFHMK